MKPSLSSRRRCTSAERPLLATASTTQRDDALAAAADLLVARTGELLEANAVLHPRGSEYDTQYVIDGMPVYDNRSIAFAPAFENSEFEAVSILTAGIPAEYGRRLGGVIALDTRRAAGPGNHSELDLKDGSYERGVDLDQLVDRMLEDL